MALRIQGEGGGKGTAALNEYSRLGPHCWFVYCGLPVGRVAVPKKLFMVHPSSILSKSIALIVIRSPCHSAAIKWQGYIQAHCSCAAIPSLPPFAPRILTVSSIYRVGLQYLIRP